MAEFRPTGPLDAKGAETEVAEVGFPPDDTTVTDMSEREPSALDRIDTELSALAGRSLVDAASMVDFLLDLRQLLALSDLQNDTRSTPEPV